MPRRHRNFRRRRPLRRRIRRNRGRGRRGYTTVVHRGLGFVAPRTIVRMKYSDEFTLTDESSTFQYYQFRLNSVYDPDFTGTGHQPYGYDQLAALYSRYRVFATHWIITIPATNDAVHFCVVPTNGNISWSDFSQMVEYPRGITKSVSNGVPSIVFRGKIYLPKLGGDKRVEYKSDDRFQASVGSNPVESMLLNIGYLNPSTTVSIVARASVVITFVTEWYDPFIQTPS